VLPTMVHTGTSVWTMVGSTGDSGGRSSDGLIGLGDIGCPSPSGPIWKKSSPSDVSEVAEVVQESSSSSSGSGSCSLQGRLVRTGSVFLGSGLGCPASPGSIDGWGNS